MQTANAYTCLVHKNMCGSRNFCQGVGPGPTARKQLDNILLVLNLYYSFTVVYQWLISSKTIIFQGFRGGPIFSRGGGVQPFPAGGGGLNFFQGGGGVKMLISIETHRTCDFPGGGPDPIPRLGPRMPQ